MQANGQLIERRGVPAADRRLPQRPPVRLERARPRHRQRRERQDRELVQRRSARIILAIQRQPGTNTVEVVDAHQGAAARVPRSRLPPSVNLDILYDRSRVRSASRSTTCKFTLLLTLGLVVLVIFLFLRNVSATIIPSLALPISIVGTFAVMYLLGYSLDNLSLMALTLSVGFVVDDAIVMLENIVRHMEMGETPHAGGARRRRARSASPSSR